MRPFHRFAIIVAALMLTFPVQAQHFDWVRTYTAPDISSDSPTNRIIGSCVDSAGNFYFIGEFSPQASLCGVNLIPHNIITVPITRAVVIAKLSPQGDLLWHKAIYSSLYHLAANGLSQMGDTAFMVMATVFLPYDRGYGQYNNLYYLDTLLTGNDDYLVSTDSICDLRVNAFITFGNDGTVLEQHFLCTGWKDSTGVLLTPRFVGELYYMESVLDKMHVLPLSEKTFNVDNEGNIYVVRQATDYVSVLCDTCDDGARYWSITDGTIGTVKVMVDGVRSLDYHPDRRSALWNYQIMKFSPHFDSLLSAVYVFDSTDYYTGFPDIIVRDFNVDNQGNVYINMSGNNIPDSLIVPANDTHLVVDVSSLVSFWMIKYNADIQATDIVQMSYIGDSSEGVAFIVLGCFIDEETNTIFLPGQVHWSSWLSVEAGLYNDDTLDLINSGAFWIRLNKENLDLLSYGQVSPGENGMIHNIILSAQNNRVFSQIIFNATIIFSDTIIDIPSTLDDNAFVIWDYEGHELYAINYHCYGRNHLVSKPMIVDSIVYLSGTLYAAASFDTITTQTMGHSYAYIAKYVDTAFMTPYTPRDTTHTEPVDTGDVSIMVVPEVGAFTVYPNPFRQRVNITVENAELKTVNGTARAILTDVMGRSEEVLLTPQGNGNYILDLTARPQASYILTLTTADDKQYTVQLLKQSDRFGK